MTRRHTIPVSISLRYSALFALLVTFAEVLPPSGARERLTACIAFVLITVAGTTFLRWFFRVELTDSGLRNRSGPMLLWADASGAEVSRSFGLYRGVKVYGPKCHAFVHYGIARHPDFVSAIQGYLPTTHPVRDGIERASQL